MCSISHSFEHAGAKGCSDNWISEILLQSRSFFHLMHSIMSMNIIMWRVRISDFLLYVFMCKKKLSPFCVCVTALTSRASGRTARIFKTVLYV